MCLPSVADALNNRTMESFDNESSYESRSSSEREYAQSELIELSRALIDITIKMRDLARNSSLSNVDSYLPSEMSELRRAVEATRGLPIQGEQVLHEYFVPAEETYKRGLLRYRRHGSYDFQGVIRGVGEVPTPALKAGEIVNRLCISVDPLYTLHDPDLSRYYAERSWVDQLRHPFAATEYQDTTIFIRVDALSDRGVRLVDQWQTT